MSALHDRIDAYLNSVCEQIRWKRAREGTAQELLTHLLDQTDAYLELGMDEDTAIRESVRQMGDPVETGALLDRIHRPKSQWRLFFLVGLLLVMGYITQTTLREVAAITVYANYDPLFYEALWLRRTIPGVLLMLLVYFLDYTILARRPLLYFWAGIAGSLVVLLNSQRFSGRYYEFQQWMLLSPLLLALLVYSMRGKKLFGLLSCLCGTALLSGMAMLIPNITMALLIFCSGILLTVLSVAHGWMKLPVKRTLILIGSFLLLSVAILCWHIIFNGYYLRRILIVFNPKQDPWATGYQILLTRSILSGARWIGQGEVSFNGYHSVEQILPELESASLLTWLIHRQGWLAGLILIGVFVLFLGWMLNKSLRHRSVLGSLISTAVVFTLTLQVISFVLYNLGFPIIGNLSLPLINYGRWRTAITLGMIGLTLSVFREEELPVKQNIPKEHNRHSSISEFIFWQNGNLVIAVSQLKKLLLRPFNSFDE